MKISDKEAKVVLDYLLKRIGCKSTKYECSFMYISTDKLQDAVLCAFEPDSLHPFKSINCGNVIESREKQAVLRMFELSSQGKLIVILGTYEVKDVLKPFTSYEQIAIEAAMQCGTSFDS